MQQSNIKIKELQFTNADFLPEVVKLVDEGHTCTIQLRGFSMRPFLEDNRDKALLAKPKALRVGDPVLAEVRKDFYVLHRIIDIDTKNNIETCRQEDVKALAVGFYRKGRKTIDSIDSRKWKMYSAIWTRLYPIRRYLLFIYRKVFV